MPKDFNDLKCIFTCIDNTTLLSTDTRQRVQQLCERSIQMRDDKKGIGNVAAVCVWPVFVKQARQILQGSGIKVASVAGAFPSAQSPLKVKLQEVSYAIDEGVDEIDIPISRGAFLEGEYNLVFDEIASIRQISKGNTLKVILETGELPSPTLIAKASQIAIDAGADFIKTSTGKSAVSATPEAAEVMLNVIKKHFEKTGKRIGFKAAGGISTPEEVLKYYSLFTHISGIKNPTNQFFRIGASRLTENLFSFLTEQNLCE